MLSPSARSLLHYLLLLLVTSPITHAAEKVGDRCGPSIPPPDPNAPSTCFVNSTWSGGMNGQQAQQDSYYNFTEALVNAPSPINPVDCSFVIPALCGLLANPDVKRDVWHWNELGGCRGGMFIPGRPGAAPLVNVDQCQWQIWYPMLQDGANWGIPKQYYGPESYGQINLVYINIKTALGGGTGFPKNDSVQHVFPQTNNGVLFNDGYPAYILEFPSTH